MTDGAALARECARYGLCSALALAVDTGALLTLHQGFALHYLLSAAIGFSAGLFVAYALSIRFAFSQRRVDDARSEFLIFALVGVLGLGLTQALLQMFVDVFGAPVLASKLMTAGFVFIFNFGARKVLLFTRVA